nr:hypothetical protein [Tanacetum cinerariifolium]
LMLSGAMLNEEVRSLSLEVLKLRGKVFELRNEKLKYAALISCLEAELLCTKVATEASLKTELEVFKEKLDSANEDRSLMVTDLLPHVVKILISSDSFSTLLAGLQRKACLLAAQAFK